MNNLNAILTIAYRDFLKFVRDRARLVSTFIFPVLLPIMPDFRDRKN